MARMKDLKDLMIHELKDIYSAETQLINAIPKLAGKAKNSELRNALNKHLDETKHQKERLDQIAKELNTDLQGITCIAVQSMIQEGEKLMGEDADDNVRDAGIIAESQKVEHYEIASYGTLHYYAEELGLSPVAKLLAETLQEEKNADTELNDLAKSRVNQKAEMPH